MTSYVSRRGSVLVTCTLVLVIVSVMAVTLASLSGANLEVASIQQTTNRAFANTESGLEISRYWLSRVRIPSSTPPAQYLSAVVASVQSDLTANSIVNMTVNADGSIPPVILDSLGPQRFSGQWSWDAANPAVLRVRSVGSSGMASRLIAVDYAIAPYHFPIFNYGIATKGPLNLAFNPTIGAATEGWEADIYVESGSSLIAVDIDKNATLAGDIDIGNPNAGVTCGGTLTQGGEIDHVAEEDHPEFPVPDVEHFLQYATGPVLDKTTDFSQSVYTNARIAPNTDPNFTAANVTIRGILYIEAPNKVMFGKITTLQGIIVADGDVNCPGDNHINFGDPTDPKTPSNFTSGPYPAGAEFDALRQEEGSCILAPGFKVSFMKNFSAINGVIAASGMYFANNATATVKGTLINYSDEPLVIDRNLNITFDRSAMVKIPAGFDLYRVLEYNPTSYTMAQ
jgi:hypothetical protein